jgi:hypothetical protein
MGAGRQPVVLDGRQTDALQLRLGPAHQSPKEREREMDECEMDEREKREAEAGLRASV